MVKPIEHVFALHFERIRLGIRFSWVCLDTMLRVPPLRLLRGLSVSKQLLSVMYNIFSTVFLLYARIS